MQQQSNTFIMSDGNKQYTMFDLDQKTKDIWYWENVLSCPNELVGFIEELDDIPESHQRIHQWTEWTASDNSNVSYGKLKIADSYVNSNIIQNKKIEQKTRYIINSIKMAIEMCSEKYLDGHNLNKNQYRLDNDAIKIRKWDIGQSMGPHADGQDGNYGLAYTIVLYLNDTYDGGEIVFPNHDISIKPKRLEIKIQQPLAAIFWRKPAKGN